jgi:hypothetical protein
MFDILSYIGEKLNRANIVWGVGASILLNQYGLIDKPNDIDIVVDMKDVEKADEILRSIGEKKKCEKSEAYSTRYFYEYIVGDCDIDVMSGLRIKHSGGVFEYIFDSNSVSEITEIRGVDIPFMALEDWYVIYQVLPNREAKARMVESYLLSNGVKKIDLLQRALTCNLPDKVKARVETILRNPGLL